MIGKDASQLRSNHFVGESMVSEYIGSQNTLSIQNARAKKVTNTRYVPALEMQYHLTSHQRVDGEGVQH